MVNNAAVAIKTASMQEVWQWLGEIPDPEMPMISICDLGIVRDVVCRDDAGEAPRWLIVITPTYMGCPATATIARDIKTKLRGQGLHDIAVETRLLPTWTTDWLSTPARQKLLDAGIAPPLARPASAPGCQGRFALRHIPAQDKRDAVLPPCPRCRSRSTQLRSEVGSTPCKSLYVCAACRNPFEYFKCH